MMKDKHPNLSSVIGSISWYNGDEGNLFWEALYDHIYACEDENTGLNLPEFKEGMSFDEYAELVDSLEI